MTKVVKILLISEQVNTDGNVIDFKEINKILWDLQRQTREIKNKSVQLCWEWLGWSSDYNKQNGEYPKEKDVLDYTLSGFVYDKVKNGSDLYASNLSTSSRDACTAFKNAKKEILRGDKSIISYKANQPLDLHNKAITLTYEGKDFFFGLKLLNKCGAEKYGFGTSVRFKGLVKDKSTRTILERCIDGIYKISASKLLYNQKKKMWEINLSYSFDAAVVPGLDENKILGVDIGVVYPICASVEGDLDRFIIRGGEIEEFRKRTEARRISLLKQSTVCGDGRIGHGRKKRTEPAYKVSDKIARFRDTANHKYSRALIDYAIKKGCGTIQMEDLKGITGNADKFLKNWSYYDLQSKIENKAKEAGIKVVYIEPRYTSQRCHKCGCIREDNRPEQAVFKCKECGYSANADYNASQNIAVKDIDKIIAAEMDSKAGKTA